MIARWGAPPHAAIVCKSGFGSGLPTPKVSCPQMNANLTVTPSFSIKSLAEPSILLVQIAWRHPARAKTSKAASTPG